MPPIHATCTANTVASCALQLATAAGQSAAPVPSAPRAVSRTAAPLHTPTWPSSVPSTNKLDSSDQLSAVMLSDGMRTIGSCSRMVPARVSQRRAPPSPQPVTSSGGSPPPFSSVRWVTGVSRCSSARTCIARPPGPPAPLVPPLAAECFSRARTAPDLKFQRIAVPS
eukprot:scaffold7544_cov107-Isochrysis_galbana.AAC.17